MNVELSHAVQKAMDILLILERFIVICTHGYVVSPYLKHQAAAQMIIYRVKLGLLGSVISD